MDNRRKSSSRDTRPSKRTSVAAMRDDKNTGHNGGKSRAAARERQRKRQERIIICIAAVIIVILAGCIGIATRKNGSKVLVNGEVIGIVNEKRVSADDIIDTVTAQLKAERGTNIKVVDKITLEPVHITKKMTAVTTDSILVQVRDMVKYDVEAASITADGNVIAVLNNAVVAEELLKGIKDEYIPKDSKITESTFVQKVEVKTGFVDASKIITKEEALKKFTKGTIIQKPYIVKTGDTLYRIADNNDMAVEELQSINPGLSANIRVGQQLNVNVNTPFLSVKTLENNIFTEKQPKQVKYEKDNTKDSTYKKVIQQGRDGQKEVTIQTVRVNGFIEEQKTVSETITVEPITEIIKIGTK